jgi:hypothetical protein
MSEYPRIRVNVDSDCVRIAFTALPEAVTELFRPAIEVGCPTCRKPVLFIGEMDDPYAVVEFYKRWS